MSRADLVEWILDCAKRGIYREHLMLYTSATKRETAAAIRQAKTRGMYSVPGMRNFNGDTWYQFDGEEGHDGHRG